MIKVNGLIKRYDDKEILRGISLNIPRGEVTAIIGLSGSGKSTLIRCINGLEPFHGGTVSVDDLVLSANQPAPERDRIARNICLRAGMVFQQYHLFPHRSVLDNVAEGPIQLLGLKPKDARARAAALLARVELADFAHKRPAQLSGGQQQRVAIARALAMQPRAILFDEPTAALDPKMRMEIARIINDLTNDGLTMVIVTHEMDFVRRVAHSVQVLHDGLIVESGRTADVFANPQAKATRDLLCLEAA